MSRLPLDAPISLDGRWVELPIDDDIDRWLGDTLQIVAARAGWSAVTLGDAGVRAAWSHAAAQAQQRARHTILQHVQVGSVAWTPAGAAIPAAVLDVMAVRLPAVAMLGHHLRDEVDRFFAEVRAEAGDPTSADDGVVVVGGAVRLDARTSGSPLGDDVPYQLTYVWQQAGSGCLAAVGVLPAGADDDVLAHVGAYDDLVTTLELRGVPERSVSTGLLTALLSEWGADTAAAAPPAPATPEPGQVAPARQVDARRRLGQRFVALGTALRIPLLSGSALGLLAIVLSLLTGIDSGLSLALWGGSLVGAICLGGLGVVFCVPVLITDLELRPRPGDGHRAWQPYVVTVLGFVSIAMFVVFSTYLVARGEQLF